MDRCEFDSIPPNAQPWKRSVDPAPLKNWSHGQYNSAPPCAMLSLEDFDHPVRMVTLSEHREPKGLHMSLMSRATSPAHPE